MSAKEIIATTLGSTRHRVVVAVTCEAILAMQAELERVVESIRSKNVLL